MRRPRGVAASTWRDFPRGRGLARALCARVQYINQNSDEAAGVIVKGINQRIELEEQPRARLLEIVCGLVDGKFVGLHVHHSSNELLLIEKILSDARCKPYEANRCASFIGHDLASVIDTPRV